MSKPMTPPETIPLTEAAEDEERKKGVIVTDPEGKAMAQIIRHLEPVSVAGRKRIASYLHSRYCTEE